MELTVGFISLFLMLVLPGITFRRFYFLGEFSKQISTSEPILVTIAYSLIPGVLIQIFALWIYTTLPTTIDKDFILIFQSLLSDEKDVIGTPQLTLELLIRTNFILYCLGVYSLSMLLGYTCFLLVRYLRLDRKIKLLRFKNKWAYIFSGEIMQFHKFKGSISANDDRTKTRRFLFPHVDVLATTGESGTTLYSGYLKDYELNHGNINQLEHIYLFDAKRYKRKKYSTEVVSIPGDFIILPGANILNINVQYIYEDKTLDASEKLQRFASYYNIFLIITLLFLLFPVLVEFKFIQNDLYVDFMEKPWYKRLLFWYVLNAAYNVLFPFKKDADEHYTIISWKRFVTSLITLAVLFALFYLWTYKL